MSKILAVGDIHTKTWIIEKVEKLLDEYDHVVFCGDYADNWNADGLHSVATWRLLKALVDSNPQKVHAVVGNHDYAYLHKEIAGHSSGFNPITYTLINTPENKKLKSFLESLPPIIELDGVTFSHAGITESWDGNLDVEGLWRDDSPIWARPFDITHGQKYKDNQVFGHTPSKTCWKVPSGENVWCIDTFSEYQDNSPIGDQTVLEIINGKEFNIKSLNNENNNNTTSLKDEVS